MTETTKVSPAAKPRRRAGKTIILQAALEQCAAGFKIKPADSNEIDWESMAREFYRRMAVANEALSHVR